MAHKRPRADGCLCQVKGQRRCPVHPQRETPGLKSRRPYGSGPGGKLLAKIIAERGPGCHYCGVNLEREDVLGTIDHRVPTVRGGTNDLDNLVPSCFVCNWSKDDLTEEEFRQLLGTPWMTARMDHAGRTSERMLAEQEQ